MAIKASNQITITEHKKITKIKEWYLAASEQAGITKDNIEDYSWTETIQTIDSTNKYLWNYEEVVYSIGDSDISDPVIIGVYVDTVPSLQIKYISSVTVPIIENNDVSEWSDTVPTPANGQKVYMIQKMSTDTDWSTPLQISAIDGDANVVIIDGYWYINGESTGVKAEGEDGTTPSITIGENGNWYINNVDSGTKAQGESGRDGSDIEYVYYRSEDEVNLSAPSYVGKVLTDGWTQSPQGITETYKYEYVSVRNKPPDGNWSEFSLPVIWSKWGEKGQDGDGVEYKYYLSDSEDKPIYSVGTDGWTDDPTGVSKDEQYEYVVQIKTINGSQTISDVALWAKFGEDGKGISSITNYYNTTKTADKKPDSWKTDFPTLTPTNKYLWNYEKILYSDGSTTETDPAIIGAYGDSGADGTDAVDFQIYSPDGFEFNKSVNTITLKTVAFQGGKKIESGCTYQWQKWNDNSQVYEDISKATTSTLTVTSKNYAQSSLKCKMTYDNIVYEDHVALTKKEDIYVAVIKFFDGDNQIETDDTASIVYVELYKNNEKIEGLDTAADEAYKHDTNIVSGNYITTNINGVDGEKKYFICEDSTDTNNKYYNVVLGQYSASSGKWVLIKSKYVYNNTFNKSVYPVIYIPKEKIVRALNVDFEIYEGDDIVAITNTRIVDLNDPVVSSTAPSDPIQGQMWLDASTTPNILKMWDGAKWVNSNYQKGNVVYTSKPDNYSKGDLWILGKDEKCGDFGEGCMLRANQTSSVYDESHWDDVDEEGTKQKENIKQYFAFDKTSGLKVGQSDDKFYVNISSTEMGFYDAEDGTPEKVVSIGNKSATIKDMTVKEGAKFECEVQFGNFIWKTEKNGSLSLALAT